MRTLIPAAIEALARPLSRAERSWTGRVLPLGLTMRGLLLFTVGLVFVVPAFWHIERIWLMVAWDALLVALIAYDAMGLPAPANILVKRTFLDSPRLGEATRVELDLTQQSSRILSIAVTDELDATLMPTPETRQVGAFPRDAVRAELTCFPGAAVRCVWARSFCGIAGC